MWVGSLSDLGATYASLRCFDFFIFFHIFKYARRDFNFFLPLIFYLSSGSDQTIYDTSRCHGLFVQARASPLLSQTIVDISTCKLATFHVVENVLVCFRMKNVLEVFYDGGGTSVGACFRVLFCSKASMDMFTEISAIISLEPHGVCQGVRKMESHGNPWKPWKPWNSNGPARDESSWTSSVECHGPPMDFHGGTIGVSWDSI